MANPHANDSSGMSGSSVGNSCIQFDRTVMVEYRAPSGIQLGIVLETAHGLFDSVQSAGRRDGLHERMGEGGRGFVVTGHSAMHVDERLWRSHGHRA